MSFRTSTSFGCKCDRGIEVGKAGPQDRTRWIDVAGGPRRRGPRTRLVRDRSRVFVPDAVPIEHRSFFCNFVACCSWFLLRNEDIVRRFMGRSRSFDLEKLWDRYRRTCDFSVSAFSDRKSYGAATYRVHVERDAGAARAWW